MYMNNIKGITYFEEDREPTPDNPNNIISIGVDERVANYIDRLERKLEEKDKEIERLNNIIKAKDEGFKASIEELTDYANRIDKTIEFIENDNTIVGKDINGELYAYELKILDMLKGE